MNISISYYSACGDRPKNEDAVSLLEGTQGTLAVVADGLGGYGGGEIAAQTAISSLNHSLQEKSPTEKSLVAAINEANRAVLAKQDATHSMKTTVAVLWLTANGALAANVGDSRIYQFRGGKIIYQSMDHSVAQLAVLVGEITADELRSHEDRNKLIRVLGNAESARADVSTLYVSAGDVFLICTDGFWNAVTEDVMCEELLRSTSVECWLLEMRRKVELACIPGQDNHSALALQVKALKEQVSWGDK